MTTYNTTQSFEETFELGKTLAAQMISGDIVLLTGDLGAGKTSFAKGIIAGLGIHEHVTSPTFTMMNVYTPEDHLNPHVDTIIHVDTYRLEEESDLIHIGLGDYIGAQGTVTIVEWPEKLEQLLQGQQRVTTCTFHAGTHNDERTIEISGALAQA